MVIIGIRAQPRQAQAIVLFFSSPQPRPYGLGSSDLQKFLILQNLLLICLDVSRPTGLQCCDHDNFRTNDTTDKSITRFKPFFRFPAARYLEQHTLTHTHTMSCAPFDNFLYAVLELTGCRAGLIDWRTLHYTIILVTSPDSLGLA
jgi:hypothetical protein